MSSIGLRSGPDGNRDYRSKKLDQPMKYIGNRCMPKERSSEVSYLWRSASTTVHPPRASSRVGAIGWDVNGENRVLKTINKRMPITRGEFRQTAEDKYSHCYQNPWAPHPKSQEYKTNPLGRDSVFFPHDRFVLNASRRCGCLTRATTSRQVPDLLTYDETPKQRPIMTSTGGKMKR